MINQSGREGENIILSCDSFCCRNVDENISTNISEFLFYIVINKFLGTLIITLTDLTQQMLSPYQVHRVKH